MATRKKQDESARLAPIGVIRSTIKKRSEAPKQASEGAPDAWLEINPNMAQGLDGIRADDGAPLALCREWALGGHGFSRAENALEKVGPRRARL